MAVPSLASFRADFPEFGASSTDGAPDALVTSVIARCALRCDEAFYGDLHTEAVALEAANVLARSPFARDMKLVAKDGSTLYSTEAARLRMIAAAGRRTF